MDVLQQLQALMGNDWSTEHIRAILPQLNALGIHVQNEVRGDYRPRFLLPDGTTWDYGPGGWVGRGNIGDWHSGSGNGEGGSDGDGGSDGGNGGDGGDGADGTTPPSSGGGGFATAPPPDLNMMTDFLRATPGYQFARDEGLQAIERSAASRGTLLTGGTMKALAKYGTGLADQTYDEATKRYLSLADLGARVATAPY